MDPAHAFWVVPGPNGEPSAVETGKLLLGVAPWLSQVNYPAGGYEWEARRRALGWQLVQRSGQNAGETRHTVRER